MLMPALMFLLSLLLLLAAYWMLQRSWRRAADERVEAQLATVREPQISVAKLGFVERRLVQAGINLPRWAILVGGSLAALILLLLSKSGWIAPLIALVLMILVVFVVAQWRAKRRVDRMIEQTPSFLDHMMRSMKSGRTMGDALMLAMERCQAPLHEAMAPVRRDIELGVPMADAMSEMALLYDRDEFHILAMGVRINQRYGGNTSDMLNSLIVMIRDRERARRQLSAMTGETRISAIVLGALPITLGAYILFSNPDFLLGMWNSSTGKVLLLLSLALQGTGCILLWRMLKSI